MSHPLLKTAIRLFYTSIALIAFAEIATACTCPPNPSVLGAYDAADAVLIVRVLSVEKVEAPKSNGSRFPENVRSLRVSIERVYKGDVKVNEQLVFHHSSRFICPSIFNEELVNTEFLIYAQAPKTNSDVWLVPGCGRSSHISQATEDLLYLDNMKKRRGKTRVSGKYGGSLNQDIVVAHRTIRIVSEDNVYETFTDDKGVFEIYDVPAGRYRLEPEIPNGWRIDRWWLRLRSSSPARLISSAAVQFDVEPKKHVSINLGFEPDNVLEGRIVEPNGNALAKTCAYLRRPDENMDEVRGSARNGCADENGRFRIESIPPGTYVLVVNPAGMAKSSEPFPRVFHPGTTELEKAVRINIALGQTVKDVNVVVPTLLDTVTVEGVLVFSDDQPVAKQSVHFNAIDKPGVIGWAIAETDEQGRFSLKILKGLQGKLESRMVVYPNTHQNCPAVNEVFERTGAKSTTFATEHRIETQQNLSNLVLRLPIPSCPPKN